MKPENTPVQSSKMLTLPTPKECPTPSVITAALGVEKKAEKQFPEVVLVFLTN
jgi:hypothetical protein